MLKTTPELEYAINAVRQTSLLVKQVQAEMVSSALTKGDRSPVTVADFAAQAFVGFLLDEAFPKDAMIGEADSSVLQTPDERETLERITYFVGQRTSNAPPESVCACSTPHSASTCPRRGSYRCCTRRSEPTSRAWTRCTPCWPMRSRTATPATA